MRFRERTNAIRKIALTAVGKTVPEAQEPAAIPASASPDAALARQLFESVRTETEAGRAVTVRDLHRLIGQPQPVALRLIDRLRADGLLRVGEQQFDPFGAQVDALGDWPAGTDGEA